MSVFSGVTRLAANRHLDSASEAALIEQCRLQNFEAFGKIVDAYQARVLGFVKRMCANTEEALDITQDVFIRAYQGFGRFDGRCSLRSWLFKIAYNLCVDRVRRNDRHPTELRLDASAADESETIDVADSRWDPEGMILDEEFQGVVELAISTMSDKLRTVLLLHDKEDMGYEEIAETMGIPVGTVKSRLFLARAHLQGYVRKYWNGETVQ
ncbi:MAG TPA: sigma-70 family RNA polymerase sigma factor [Fimbriimonadaceae bacterium]|nr:sigma-70 family RNA polymerase sigma factor [Fimbriimonadaceae bacterium]